MKDWFVCSEVVTGHIFLEWPNGYSSHPLKGCRVLYTGKFRHHELVSDCGGLCAEVAELPVEILQSSQSQNELKPRVNLSRFKSVEQWPVEPWWAFI